MTTVAWRILLFLAYVAASAAASSSPSSSSSLRQHSQLFGEHGRIVGGQNAEPDEHPFFVSWSGACGGALVHPDVVLTAAHCGVIAWNELAVNAFHFGLRDDGTVIATIQERLYHPAYDGNVNHDFLLLKLAEPIEDFVPIALNDKQDLPRQGQNLTVIGLGRTEENGNVPSTLQEAVVPVWTDEQCRDLYGEVLESQVMFCAGRPHVDSCQGDS